MLRWRNNGEEVEMRQLAGRFDVVAFSGWRVSNESCIGSVGARTRR